MSALTAEAILAAEEKIKAFMMVYRASSHEERTDAITIVLNYLGLSDCVKLQLTNTLDEIGVTPYGEGPAMIGALIVLFAYDSLNV